MRRSVLTIAMLLGTALPANAQLVGTDTAPGDSCAGFPTGASRMTADADMDGKSITLICDGTNWVVDLPNLGGTCNDGDTIVFDSASGGLACATACTDNTPDAFNFTDQANVTASTLIESDIVQITGITCQVNVSISGEGSPQYRTCSDGSSVANCDGSVIQDWTDAASGINNNEYVQARLTSSAAGGDIFTANVFAGNTVDDWNVTPDGDCTDPSPAPGTVCADGTIYAGQSPDGNVKMFTSRCDEGQSWSGAECTGSRVNLSWNNGNSSNWVTTGATSTVTGEDNTNTLDGLDSDSGTAGNQPHQAAQRCADLSLNGHTDWYLPAEQELDVLYQNNGVIGNFIITGGSNSTYWSSIEISHNAGRHQAFDNGDKSPALKSNERKLRCVRR